MGRLLAQQKLLCGAQIGYTVQARLPQRFLVTEGQAFQQQAITNQTVPITINHSIQRVGMSWSTAAATLEVEEVQESGIPVLRASRWRTRPTCRLCCRSLPLGLHDDWHTRTPITDDGTYTDGVAKLLNVGGAGRLLCGARPGRRSRASWRRRTSRCSIRRGRSARSSSAADSTKAHSGSKSGIATSNMPTHTTGTFTTATPITSSGGQTGSTLAMSGLGTYSFKAGDTFKVASGTAVNAVNPQTSATSTTYNDTGDAQEFVITADISGTIDRHAGDLACDHHVGAVADRDRVAR